MKNIEPIISEWNRGKITFKMDIRFILFIMIVIFLFVSLDMISTYRFVNVIGIQRESNENIIDLYTDIGNFAFPMFGLLAFMFIFIIFLGVYCFSYILFRKYHKIVVIGIIMLYSIFMIFVVYKNWSIV